MPHLIALIINNMKNKILTFCLFLFSFSAIGQILPIDGKGERFRLISDKVLIEKSTGDTLVILRNDNIELSVNILSTGTIQGTNIDTLQSQNPKTSSTIQTSDFTAEIGVTYQVDCSSGPITITPPSSPPVNGSFRVIDVTSNAGSNNITLGFQGSGINVYSQDTDYIINYDAADISFTYHGVTTGFTAKQ